jgi:Sec-independent protein translocase protein TatA
MIPSIGSIGGTELLIPLVIVFLFLAIKRFPELGRPLGIGVTEVHQEDAHTIGSDDGGKQRSHNKDGKKISGDRNDVPSAASKRTRDARARGGGSVQKRREES